MSLALHSHLPTHPLVIGPSPALILHHLGVLVAPFLLTLVPLNSSVIPASQWPPPSISGLLQTLTPLHFTTRGTVMRPLTLCPPTLCPFFSELNSIYRSLSC